MPQNRLELRLGLDDSEFKRRIRISQTELSSFIQNIERGAEAGSAALGSIAAGGTRLTSSFLQAAAQFESFRNTLTFLTGSVNEANAALKFMQDLNLKTRFNLEDMVRAGITLRSLGQNVEELLPLAADLATVMNRDVNDAALALGKALSGSQDGIQILNDSFGITRQNLKEMGVAMTSQGAIALESAQDLEKLRQAILGVAKEKGFLGAAVAGADTAQAAFSNLEDAVTQLKASLGEQLLPAAVAVTKQLTGMLNWVSGLSNEMKAAIAWGTVFTTALTAIGAAFLTISAFGAKVIGTLSSLASQTAAIHVVRSALDAAAASAAAFGQTTATAVAASTAALSAIGTVAIGAALAYTNAVNQEIQANEEALRVENERLAGLREHADLIGKTASQILAMGKTEDDVARLILSLHEAIQQARSSGHAERVRQLEDEVRRIHSDVIPALQQHKQAVDILSQSYRDAAAQSEYWSKTLDDALSRELHNIELLDAQGKLSKQEKLDALKVVLAQTEIGSKKRQQLELEVARRETELREEAKEKAKKAVQEQLDAELHQLALLDAAGKLSHQQKLRRLQEILNKYKALGVEISVIRSLELDIAREQKAVADEQERKRREKEEEKQRKEQEASAQQKRRAQQTTDLINDEVKAVDDQIDALEKSGRTEKDIAREKEALLKKRLQLQLAAIELAKQEALRAAEQEKASQEELANISQHYENKKQDAIRDTAAAIQEARSAVSELQETITNVDLNPIIGGVEEFVQSMKEGTFLGQKVLPEKKEEKKKPTPSRESIVAELNAETMQSAIEKASVFKDMLRALNTIASSVSGGSVGTSSSSRTLKALSNVLNEPQGSLPGGY